MKKTVTFSCVVTQIVIDDDEFSREYRKPYWEINARDRMRFQDRINELEEKLNPILMQMYQKCCQNRSKTIS